MRELRRRIRGVASIQKITRAMEMIASTRLRRMQEKAEGARPYADAIKAFSALLAGVGGELSSALMLPREPVKRITLLVISSDRGLCGAYNANLFRKVAAFLTEVGAAKAARADAADAGGTKTAVAPDLHVLGRKARQHYARRLPIKVAYPDAVEKLGFRRAREIARELTERFLKGEVDEVWVVFTRFVSAGKQVTTVDRLLPITAAEPAKDPAKEAMKSGSADAALILLEPSPQALFEALVPKSLAVRVYAAMVDSMASEQAARRVAMKAATDAAGDMIQTLSRKYNRARQEAITKELLDIIGGAEALA
jgi:F-type H+-transporting ATPase subunit gamma